MELAYKLCVIASTKNAQLIQLKNVNVYCFSALKDNTE